MSSAIACSLSGVAYTQDAKSPYTKMAPLAQYLMTDQNAEITLARSATPASISGDATVMVLTQHGYETVEKGKNGFVCIVERSWMSPFDSPEFWNPKNVVDFFQSSSSALNLAVQHQKNRVGPSWPIQNSGYRARPGGG